MISSAHVNIKVIIAVGGASCSVQITEVYWGECEQVPTLMMSMGVVCLPACLCTYVRVSPDYA